LTSGASRVPAGDKPRNGARSNPKPPAADAKQPCGGDTHMGGWGTGERIAIFRCYSSNSLTPSRHTDVLPCAPRGAVHMGAHQHISTETQEPCHDRENSHPLCLDPALPCAVPFLRACAPLTAPAQCNACNKSRGAGPSCAAPTAPRPQAGRRSEPVFLSVPAAPRSRARRDKTRRTSSPRPPDGAGPRPAARPEGASFAALAAGR